MRGISRRGRGLTKRLTAKSNKELSMKDLKLSLLSKRKLLFLMFLFGGVLFALLMRILYIQAVEGSWLQARAYEQQTRDRLISPDRGAIYDRNMIPIAVTETVASVSVIHNQVKNPEEVARELSQRLALDYELVLQKVNKRVALERIKTKVDKNLADEIRALKLPGVVIDEDIKRVYPFSTMASQVLGFVGKDNQGIIGLEAVYDKYLKGESGKILTETDIYGREYKDSQELRIEPKNGSNLVTSLDAILQQYAEQTIEKIVEAKSAKRGTIIMMNPKNGEIIAMANKPDFDLNSPFTINSEEYAAIWNMLSDKDRNDYLNKMWRNFSINDTYEPGSTFKIITSVAGLQENVVEENSPFSCSGFHVVAGRTIKCWRSPRSHGAQTFVQGVQNSCNPVFMAIAERLGAETFYQYLLDFGFNSKTGVDLPGEAVGIMHKLDKVGPVELATMSFGQSFQITPLQLMRSVSAVINGGYLITPHFGVRTISDEGEIIEEFAKTDPKQVVSKENSDRMRTILESVVMSGTGNKTYIPGYRVGGKTATSEKLPRRSGKYIASFLAFAPADDPQVLALVLIDEPQGAYYGGQVAGPVMKELLMNTLPYLNIEPIYTEAELALPEVVSVKVPNFIGKSVNDAKKDLLNLGIRYEVAGEGSKITGQFPLEGETINKTSKILLWIGD